MNEYKHLKHWSFVCFLSTWLIIMTVGCKKSSESSNAPESRFSFTYKGIHYILRDPGSTGDWAIGGPFGIFIDRPDLFNGRIYFPSSQCAYLDPQDNGGNVHLNPNCQLINSNGAPVDSIAVYFYQSGSANFLYKNCRTKRQYDLLTGYFTLEVCDVSGTFDLVLKNKENKLIEITNGTFQVYNLAR
jgi:hypothetical protein